MMMMKLEGNDKGVATGCFVGWVGPIRYQFRASASTLEQVHECNQPAVLKLFVRHKTDSEKGRQDLIAFWTESEREVFDALAKIKKVGWTTAVNILDGGVDTIMSAVKDGDAKALTKIKDVGPKTAENILKSQQLKLMAKVHK